MLSKLNVTVQDIAVPNTGWETVTTSSNSAELTSTGLNHSLNIILPVVIILAILLIIFHFHRQRSFAVKQKHTKKWPYFGIITVFFLCFFIKPILELSVRAADGQIDITTTDVSITIVRSEENTFALGSMDITLNEAIDYGYELFISAPNDSRLKLIAEDEEYYIASISSENNALVANTYGITTDRDNQSPSDLVWNQIPTDGELLLSSQSGSSMEGDKLTLYYGVLVGQDIPAGTYTGELEYNITAKPLTIDTLSYMQDFGRLNSEEKELVKNSMTPDAQYQLADSRDNKLYYIALLADGNIWMTQNLDHDIGDIDGGTYTPEDTNIPINWTPSEPEYTRPVGTTTWTNSTNTPVSADYGDLCWNKTSPEEIIADSTEPCTDRHYHIGNYYNWTAAVAMSDSSGLVSYGLNAGQSICPAGWALPSASMDQVSPYSMLIETLGLTRDDRIEPPVYYVYGGNHMVGYDIPVEMGRTGFYWIDMVYSMSVSRHLKLQASSDVIEDYAWARGNGHSVRCLVGL